jgi:hypothetical protein
MLRKTSLLLWCSLASACQITDYQSNDPDAGSCQAPTGTDAGSARAAGTRGFTVASGYQVKQAIGERQRLSFALYERPTTCASVQSEVADGGSTANGTWRFGDLNLTVNSAPDGSVAVGRAEIGFREDGGYATIERFQIEPTGAPDGGRSARYFGAKSGWVEIDSIEPCRAAGRFSAELDEGDGGTTPLDGEFSTPYCATRR